MLVLSRQIEEEIVIFLPLGEQIVVKVTDIRGDKARLGITAPKGLAVHRREVADAIDAVNGNPFDPAEVMRVCAAARKVREKAKAELVDPPKTTAIRLHQAEPLTLQVPEPDLEMRMLSRM